MRRIAASVVAGVLAASGVAGQERPFHFAYDVAPYLARQGCAAAECHGGALGRGGFKLSLFGGDPEADWRAVAVDRDGRRIDLRTPEHSLLLRKPTLALEHGGGARLGRGTAAWRALHDWIDAGASFAAGTTPTLDGLDLAIDGDRLRASARFGWTDADTGVRHVSIEDVTGRASFATSAPDVVDVDRSGRLEPHGPGAAWLFARFGGADAAVRRVVPFGPATSDRATTNTADATWRAGLAELGLEPAPVATAEILVRRLHLDLADRLPTPTERRAFVAADPAARVAATVDALLADDAFAAVAAAWLGTWFELSPADPRHDALRADLAKVAARDDSLLDAVASRVDSRLFDRLPDPRDRAELFGRAVLGVRIGCARCHDHPLDRWRRTDHLGFAALFVDARPAADAGMTAGVLFDSETGAAAVPRLLPLLTDDSRPAAHDTGRSAIARALRTPNRAFALNIANRVAHELLGRAPVEPVDDHRLTNPPIQPALLDAWADAFERSGHRLRALVRAIATSECYACSSLPTDDPADVARLRLLGRREARPLPEARLRHALASALTVPQGPWRPDAPSPLSRWLALWNGAEIAAVLDADDSALDALVLLDDDPAARLDTLFEVLLTRAPTTAERARLLPMLAAAPEPDTALRELAHAIVLSREFTSLR